MAKKNFKLVKAGKNKRIHRRITVLLVLVLLGIGIYQGSVIFSIEGINVTGNTTYTDAEVIREIQKQDYVPNTLVMMAENRIFRQTYLPFIESISMGFDDTHTLRVRVKEKLRAGVFEYMEKNVYFNSDGMAMESRNHLFEGVPIVTGVKFDKLVLGKKIPVKGDYFDTIVSMTKKISTYGLEISEIHFENENDITLSSGKFEIYLGSSDYLDGKMSKIAEVMKAVSEKNKKGVVDMHLYSDEKHTITYHK